MRWNIIIFIFILLLHISIYPFSGLSSLTWFGNLAQGLALLFAGIQFGRSAGTTRKELGPLTLIAFGFWIFVMAHILLAYSELLLGKPATGTVTDAIWLFGYALIARSLFILVGADATKIETIRLHIRLLILTIGIVSLVLWKPVSEPERDYLTKFVQVIFPFLDLWIAGMAFALSKRSRMKIWMLAGSGSLIIGAADLTFPYFYKHISPVYRYLDIPLFLGYSMWWLTGAFLATKKSTV